MRAASLLGKMVLDVPELGEFEWLVTPSLAVADLTTIGRMWREGKTLNILPPPDALPIITRLHTYGWKRWGHAEDWGWELYATTTEDDAELLVHGFTRTPPAHGNTFIDYFAPLPPPTPRRTNHKWREAYAEWDRKSRAHEW